MLSGLYGAVTGMEAALLNQDVVAQNLAHANVPGYRRSFLAFASFDSVLQQQEAGQTSATGESLGTAASDIHVDFTSGGFQHTGRSLDVAINGAGFFVLEGPNGPLYTRSGVFHLDSDGQLLGAGGFAVQGAGGGAISIPQGFGESAITVTKDGTVSVDGIQVGELQVVDFADNSQLIRAGTTMFEAPAGLEPRTTDATFEQGARELSNVVAVEELVRMIAGLRYYEASQKALQALERAIDQNTNPNAG